MSLQMVQYRSSNLQYPGYAKMQKATQINRKKQGINEEALVECDNHRCGARLSASKSNAINLILKLFLYQFLHTMSS
jgi:hypothetical protein